MKPDQLEQFVIDHRQEFDDLEPREGLFNEFEEFDKKPKKVIPLKSWKLFSRIAAAVVIFSLGFALNEFVSKDFNKTWKQDSFSVSDNDSLSMAFEEIQYYYTSEINVLKNEIILISNKDEEISNELDFQMQEFNAIFEELKKDLNDRANEEEVIEAMILNYRVKLRLLEDMKAQLNSNNQENEEVQYETIDI